MHDQKKTQRHGTHWKPNPNETAHKSPERGYSEPKWVERPPIDCGDRAIVKISTLPGRVTRASYAIGMKAREPGKHPSSRVQHRDLPLVIAELQKQWEINDMVIKEEEAADDARIKIIEDQRKKTPEFKKSEASIKKIINKAKSESDLDKALAETERRSEQAKKKNQETWLKSQAAPKEEPPPSTENANAGSPEAPPEAS